MPTFAAITKKDSYLFTAVAMKTNLTFTHLAGSILDYLESKAKSPSCGFHEDPRYSNENRI